MTRINCVPVEELADKHLMAEYRELPRIFTLVENRYRSYKPVLEDDFPTHYVLGKGHVKFFFDKLYWILRRHRKIHDELKYIRGYNIKIMDISKKLPRHLFGSWEPTIDDIKLNRIRIYQRIESKPHLYKWTKRDVPNYLQNIKGLQTRLI